MAGKKGASGRPRKPTALKLLHGDFQKDPQRRNKREPKAPSGRPACPRYLKGEERKAWQRITKLLKEMKVLSKADSESLELYSVTYAQWRSARVTCDSEGMTYAVVDAQGNTTHKRHPAQQIMKDNAAVMIKLLTEFGLTPSSRTRVQIENETNSTGELEKKFLA